MILDLRQTLGSTRGLGSLASGTHWVSLCVRATNVVVYMIRRHMLYSHCESSRSPVYQFSNVHRCNNIVLCPHFHFNFAMRKHAEGNRALHKVMCAESDSECEPSGGKGK